MPIRCWNRFSNALGLIPCLAAALLKPCMYERSKLDERFLGSPAPVEMASHDWPGSRLTSADERRALAVPPVECTSSVKAFAVAASDSVSAPRALP